MWHAPNSWRTSHQPEDAQGKSDFSLLWLLLVRSMQQEKGTEEEKERKTQNRKRKKPNWEKRSGGQRAMAIKWKVQSSSSTWGRRTLDQGYQSTGPGCPALCIILNYSSFNSTRSIKKICKNINNNLLLVVFRLLEVFLTCTDNVTYIAEKKEM